MMHKAYEYGIGSKGVSLNKLNPEIFDQKIIDKLFMFYTPQRTQGKLVYDCVDMNDGELLINCGVWYSSSKAHLQQVGGLRTLFPLLDYISQVIHVHAKQHQKPLE